MAAMDIQQNDDAALTDEERKKKSAASNQNASVTGANQVGQTASGGTINGAPVSDTKPAGSVTPDTKQTENGGQSQDDPTQSSGYVPPPVPASSTPAPSSGTLQAGQAVPNQPGYVYSANGTPVRPGTPVPGHSGFVYNQYGGEEPGGYGNPVPGMPGYVYGADGTPVKSSTLATPPAVTPPVTTTTATPKYKFANGTGPNLDKTYIEGQIKAANPGINAADLAYWVNKALTPDTYSDGKTRVGWNKYLETRMLTGSSSADPTLAGDEGVILDWTGDGSAAPTQGSWGQTPPTINIPASTVAPLTNPFGGAAPITAAQVTTPTYQTYDFGQRSVGTQTINPANISSYKAGTLDQYKAPDVSPINDAISSLLAQLNGITKPDVAGEKESQKETLNALRQQQQGTIAQSAASRGVSGGIPAALNAQADDQFAGDLTKSYRDIDQQAAETQFANILKALGAGEDVSNLLTTQGQSNFKTGLEGQTAQEQLNQAQAASEQAKSAQQQTILTDLFNQMMANQQLGLSVDTAQAGEGKFASTQALQQGTTNAQLLQDAAKTNASNTNEVGLAGQQIEANRNTTNAQLDAARQQITATLANSNYQLAQNLGQMSDELFWKMVSGLVS